MAATSFRSSVASLLGQAENFDPSSEVTFKLRIPYYLTRYDKGAFQEAIDTFVKQQGVEATYAMQALTDDYGIKGPRNAVIKLLREVHNIADCKGTSTPTIEAPFYLRGSFRRQVELGAYNRHLQCTVREFRGGLGSSFVLELEGPLEGVTEFLSAIEDSLHEANGELTYVQQRERQLEQRAKDADRAAKTAAKAERRANRQFFPHKAKPATDAAAHQGLA